MVNYKNVTNDVYWVGGNDRRLALFENVYPIPKGVSYNSYLALDEKTVLLDTVDRSVSGIFFENITKLLGGRTLDYVIVNHMEPDHSGTLSELLLRYPNVEVVGNTKTFAMIEQFISEVKLNRKLVSEGESLNTGRHNFTFVTAPMVHWVEVMVTYDSTDKILFSADAFGTFGALGGSIFADELKFGRNYGDEARRYYTNIVGKYGNQVNALLRKAAGLDISYICPLHGPIFRNASQISKIIGKYSQWASYKPEEQGVLIAYASVYGNTENAAEILADKLAQQGVTNVVLYDVSVTHASYIVAEAFKYSHLVFASTTYNGGVFVNMENLLNDIKAHNLQNRTVAFIENGSWAPQSGVFMRQALEGLKNINVLTQGVTLNSAVHDLQVEELSDLATAIVSTLPNKHTAAMHESNSVEPSALFKLTYGLFVLSVNDGTKDTGCIINTAMQVTDKPRRILIAVNKANYTHDVLVKTGVFNISVLSEAAPFAVFENFGFRSGRASDVNKFDGLENIKTSANGLKYLTGAANAFISAKVVKTYDYDTHTLFIAEVTEAAVTDGIPSVTYSYYQDNIKPKPVVVKSEDSASNVKRYVCKICGYVHEGELPEDIICPLCKHGADDFELLED